MKGGRLLFLRIPHPHPIKAEEKKSFSSHSATGEKGVQTPTSEFPFFGHQDLASSPTLVGVAVTGRLGVGMAVAAFSVRGVGLCGGREAPGVGPLGLGEGATHPQTPSPPPWAGPRGSPVGREGVGALTQGVGDEVQEGVPQEAPRGEAEQQLEQGLMLGAVGLHGDQEEDEVGGSADQEGRPEGLRGRERAGGASVTEGSSSPTSSADSKGGREKNPSRTLGETPHPPPLVWRQPGGRLPPPPRKPLWTQPLRGSDLHPHTGGRGFPSHCRQRGGWGVAPLT